MMDKRQQIPGMTMTHQKRSPG